MQFSASIAKTLAAAMILAAPALGGVIPESDFALQSRSLDITVKFWDTTTCKKSGPKREYSAGTCLPLPESSHAVSMQDKRAGCYMKRYKNGNCQGNGEKLENLDDCYNIGDAYYSLKFFC